MAKIDDKKKKAEWASLVSSRLRKAKGIYGDLPKALPLDKNVPKTKKGRFIRKKVKVKATERHGSFPTKWNTSYEYVFEGEHLKPKLGSSKPR